MQWSFEERAQIVLRLARAEVRMADVMAHHGLNPATVEIWVGEFLHAARERFSAEMVAQLQAQGLIGDDVRAEQSGRIEEVQPLDLLQSLGIYRRPGHVLFFHAEGVSQLWFANGEIVDARSGALRRAAAVYRIVAHEAGDYRVEVTGREQARRIEVPASALIFEAARRLDESRRLDARLPPADVVLQTTPDILMTSETSEGLIQVAESFGHGATLGEVLERSAMGELETRTLVAELETRDLLRPTGQVRPPDVPSAERRVHALRQAELEVSRPVVTSIADGLVDPGLAPRQRRWIPALAGSLAATVVTLGVVMAGSGAPDVAPAPVVETTARALPPLAVTGPPPSPCPDGMAFLPTTGHDTALCIDRHEITVAQYRACAERGDCSSPHADAAWPRGSSGKRSWSRHVAQSSERCNAERPGADEHPMNCVTWAQADAYCRSREHRLPSDAQWERAARGLEHRHYPWGSAPPTAERTNACGLECTRKVPAYAQADAHEGTAPRGHAPLGATPQGVHEMSGNVREWTNDVFTDHGQTAGSGGDDRRWVRGGGFTSVAREELSTAYRRPIGVDERHPDLGFRCAWVPGR